MPGIGIGIGNRFHHWARLRSTSEDMVHTATINLLADPDETAVLGSDFTPAITKDPAFVSAIENGSPLYGLSWRFTNTDGVYTLYFLYSEAKTNIKINVLCGS